MKNHRNPFDKKAGKPRSPIKAPALRIPGQSLDEQIDDLLNDKMSTWLLVAIFSLVFALMEWWRWYTQNPPTPGVITVAAVVVIGFSAFRVRSHRKSLKLLKLGRDGERAVGQFLDDLRSQGCQVFHDIQGDGFNVDHLVVSPHGIYTVETKTLSLPSGKEPRITCEGDSVLVNGKPLDRNPIHQARSQAVWVRDLLKESIGRIYEVQPVVVFPGWFVEPGPNCRKSGAWILNPKALPKFIEHNPVVLLDEDVRLASHHLRLHIRATR